MAAQRLTTPRVPVSAKIHPDLLARLKEHGNRSRRSVSELVEMAVSEYLKRHEVRRGNKERR